MLLLLEKKIEYDKQHFLTFQEEKTHIYTSMNSIEIEEKYYKQEVEEAGGDFPSTCYYLSTEKNPSSRFLFFCNVSSYTHERMNKRNKHI